MKIESLQHLADQLINTNPKLKVLKEINKRSEKSSSKDFKFGAVMVVEGENTHNKLFELLYETQQSIMFGDEPFSYEGLAFSHKAISLPEDANLEDFLVFNKKPSYFVSEGGLPIEETFYVKKSDITLAELLVPTLMQMASRVAIANALGVSETKIHLPEGDRFGLFWYTKVELSPDFQLFSKRYN